MKTNSYSLNISQCIYAKQCFILLKLKHTYCPEMTTFFLQKGTINCTELFKRGFMILQCAASRYGHEPDPCNQMQVRIQIPCCISLLDQVYSPSLHSLTLYKTVIWILKYCIGTNRIQWSWYSIFMVLTQPVLESTWISQIWREAGQLLGSLSCLYYQSIFL